MSPGGAFNWVLVALSGIAAAVGIAALVRHRGPARFFLALTAVFLFAVFLIPTLLYAPFSGEQQLLGPEVVVELERTTGTVFEIVPILLVLTLAAFLTGLTLLLLKRE